MEGWDDSFQGSEGVTTDQLMKQVMIHGVESFKAWLGKKYLFSEENYIQVNSDIETWINDEFEEEEVQV